MPGPVLRLTELTWTEVEALPTDRTVALLAVGAVEAHGPHLPLGTDRIIAESMARAAALRLAEKDFVPLLLPQVTYTAAPFAAGFPGTISVRAETVTALIVGIADALAESKIGTLGLANAHLDPAHLGALHEAVDTIRGKGQLRVAFPDLTRKPWVLRLTEEFQSGACHAGRYEGSVVMAARPELVREEIQSSLEPNLRSLSSAIREGKKTFEDAGGERAYFGDPAAASAEEGGRTIESLGEILEEAILAEIHS